MIEITNYEPVEKGHTTGILDIYLKKMDMHMRGIRVVEKEGSRWFNPPVRCEELPSGEKKWIPYFEFESIDTKKRFNESLEKSFDQYVQQMQEQPAPAQGTDDSLPF